MSIVYCLWKKKQKKTHKYIPIEWPGPEKAADMLHTEPGSWVISGVDTPLMLKKKNKERISCRFSPEADFTPLKLSPNTYNLLA